MAQLCGVVCYFVSFVFIYLVIIWWFCNLLLKSLLSILLLLLSSNKEFLKEKIEEDLHNHEKLNTGGRGEKVPGKERAEETRRGGQKSPFGVALCISSMLGRCRMRRGGERGECQWTTFFLSSLLSLYLHISRCFVFVCYIVR